jgi:glycosyltransferase involved in cell wall biosynthesis
MQPSVSVVVPVLNEVSGIGALLESLHGQSYPITQVFVADGGSTDGTRELIASDPAVTLLDNPRRHAAAGRNVALECCTGDWVLFTDGDCRPAPDWADKLMAAARSGSDVVGVGGRVTAEPANAFEKVCAATLLDTILGHNAGSRRITAKSLDGALITANCAYRRDILDRVRGFDERFSNFGEDIDLMFRVLDLGAGTLLHTEDATVVGEMPATLGAVARKWRQYGMASAHLNKYHYRRVSVDTALYRRAFRLVWEAATRPGPARTEALIAAASLAAHIGGKLEGSARLRTVNL